MILDKIIDYKKQEVAQQKKRVPLADLEKRLPERKGSRFKKALAGDGISLIAEVKKASPSKGILVENFDPVEIAACYEENGAAAVSVLTDEKFFQGSLDYLYRVRQTVRLPVLRKEFIIDPYQIYEAAVYGADAVLLITAVLTGPELALLNRLACDLGLDALVEVHTRRELETALEAGTEIIGINNRDLQTFKTDLQTTLDLVKSVPESCPLVSESGIFTAGDVRLLEQAGVDAVLVGEALVTAPCMAQKVRELAGR